MPAHLEGRAIDPLAVSLIGVAVEFRAARECVVAADERRDEHLAPEGGQMRGEVRRGIDSRRQAHDHLGRPVGIGQRDDAGHRRSLRLEEQPLGRDAVQHGPSHGVDRIRTIGRRRDERIIDRGRDELQALRRDSRIDGSNDRAELLAIRRDALLVGFEAAVIALPQRVPLLASLLNFLEAEAVQPLDHEDIQRLVDRQRLSPRHLGRTILGGGGCRTQTDRQGQKERAHQPSPSNGFTSGTSTVVRSSCEIASPRTRQL